MRCASTHPLIHHRKAVGVRDAEGHPIRAHLEVVHELLSHARLAVHLVALNLKNSGLKELPVLPRLILIALDLHDILLSVQNSSPETIERR